MIIDDFKRVNDTYGHATEDVYLIEFSKRFSSIDFGCETIRMRIAGDEIGLYMHGMDDVSDSFATRFWDEIERVLTSEPIFSEADPLAVACSAGLAVYNRDTTNVYELKELADRAMYQAKCSGKHACRMFESAV